MIEQKNNDGEVFKLMGYFNSKSINYGDIVDSHYDIKIVKATCPQFHGDIGTVEVRSKCRYNGQTIPVDWINLVWTSIEE